MSKKNDKKAIVQYVENSDNKDIVYYVEKSNSVVCRNQ